MMSQDNQTFYAMIDKMNSEKFDKTTLFNLVDTAETSSSECKKIVFIISKEDQDNFASMDRLLSVIDA
jgi:hypothetical protein